MAVAEKFTLLITPTHILISAAKPATPILKCRLHFRSYDELTVFKMALMEPGAASSLLKAPFSKLYTLYFCTLSSALYTL
jgi:hypothetical protein